MSFAGSVSEEAATVNGSRRIFRVLIGKIGNREIRLVPSGEPRLSESHLIALVLSAVVRRYRAAAGWLLSKQWKDLERSANDEDAAALQLNRGNVNLRWLDP